MDVLPEAIPAMIVAMCGPFWAIKWITEGNALAAVLLLGTEIACGFGFFEGWRAGHKWLAYGSMMVFLGVVYLVHSVAK